jgi:hypothetical protein
MKKQAKWVWFLGSLCIFSLVVCDSLFAAGADPNEPNETAGAATLLTPGSYEGIFELGNTTDVDYYKVAMSAGENLTVQLYDKAFSMSMVLYYPNQSYITGYLDLLYAINVTVSGDYLIMIMGDSVNTGNYSLKINKIADDAFEDNDGLGSAKPISFGTAYTDLQLMDNDTYSFPLSIWDPLHINLTRVLGGNSIRAYVYLPNMTLLYSWSIFEGETWMYQTIARVPGTYYLLVSFENEGFGNYSLKVDLEEDDSYEPNNDFGSATALTANTHYPHLQLMNPDFYIYTATAGDAINLTITRNSTGSNPIYLYIYLADMATQYGFTNYIYTNDKKSIQISNCSAGVYYIKATVSNNFTSGTYAGYNLTLNQLADDGYESNNDGDNAAALTPNSNYPNLLINNDDWFSVALGAGANISITLFRGGVGYVHLYVYDSDKTSVLGYSTMINPGNDGSCSYLNPSGAKSIYIKVMWTTAFGGCYGDYNLTLGYIGEDIYEDNDVFGDAKLLGYSTYQNLLCTDDDWFKFNVNATQHLILLTLSTAVTLVLYDSSQVQVATSWLYYGVYPCINLTATVDSTYYLKITSGQTELYTLYTALTSLSHPADMTYTVGAPNKNITWTAHTLGVLASGSVARIYRNGVIIASVSVSANPTGYSVVHDLAGLPVGSYYFHVVLNGTNGFMVTDSLYVTIGAVPGGGTTTTTTSTDTSTTSSSSTGTNSSSNSSSTSSTGSGSVADDSIDGYLPGMVVGGMGIALLVLVKRRKKYIS